VLLIPEELATELTTPADESDIVDESAAGDESSAAEESAAEEERAAKDESAIETDVLEAALSLVDVFVVVFAAPPQAVISKVRKHAHPVANDRAL